MKDCSHCMNQRYLEGPSGEAECPACRAKSEPHPNPRAALEAAVAVVVKARPIPSHLTEACDHEESDWCQHCEEGCVVCGSLDGVNDDSRCESCQLDSNIMAAEAFYEGER